MYISNVKLLWVLVVILFVILISIQFTLNQILKELRRIKSTDLSQHYPDIGDEGGRRQF